MTDAEQREAARQFANKWKGRGREDEDGRSYWIDFLSNVLGMANVTDRVEFEKKVEFDGNTKRIDVYIPETHVLIEQKSLGKALDQKIMNSGSVELTPYDQAKRYNDIVNNRVFLIPNADLYMFGILNSNVHNAWMRKVAVRLKDDYSYSKDLVYNTFPLPELTEERKKNIAQTAKSILDARALYPNSSLADLYDPLTMPPELLKAHNANNRTVMAAYGFSIKMTEADCVAELMRMYQILTEEK